ncbi:MAG: isocitrate/isopropylmalate dehydrogenase family protein [Armatimonadetes bacterium]|nr:isocitrate/isopropylmalate dehydrogenase family protein [Armatimonadota bacterium]
MAKKIALIPGDGIGPEVSNAATSVVDALGVKIDWVELEVGAAAFAKYGKPVPDHVFDEVKDLGVALKGPATTPIGGGFSSPNVALRQGLDLYASLRPVRTLPGVKSRFSDVDIVVVRENTEGLYSSKEHLVVPGVAESLKICTEQASIRIAEFAFDYAVKNNRRKVTAVHKANIMKLTDGMFLECARKVSHKYGDIEYNELIVDNVCMQLVIDPTRFDVLLMENLYGDIVSELCSGLVGGVGVVPGANYGRKAVIFEAVHGSAPDIAGKNRANPLGIILSARLMLDHIGEHAASERLYSAILKLLSDADSLTPDLGGKAGTREMTSALIARL